MKISRQNLARLKKGGANVPEPPKAPEDKPMTQAEMMATITAALEKSKDKTSSYRFEISRDKEGRIQSITARPIDG
jgi:hypothetical protein